MSRINLDDLATLVVLCPLSKRVARRLDCRRSAVILPTRGVVIISLDNTPIDQVRNDSLT